MKLKPKPILGLLILLSGILVLSTQTVKAKQLQIAQSDFPHGLASSEAQDIINGNGKFGFALFQALRSKQKDKNTVISPVTICGALELMLNAANGKTYKDLAECLGVSYQKLETINQTNADQLKALLNTDLKVEQALCDSLWANREIYFKQEFLNIGKQYFNAKIKVEDFSSPDIMPDINNWLAGATSGRINTIVDTVDPHDVFMPLTATYFRGPWLTPFADAGTSAFHLADGSTTNASMMKKVSSLPYFKGQNFQAISIPYAIRLPYDSNRLSMYVIMPDAGVPFDSFVSGINETSFGEWITHMSPTNCQITMPRFHTTSELELSDALKSLGMADAFDREKADFGKMCFVRVPTCIGQIKHKAVLAVDAEGLSSRGKHQEGPAPVSVSVSIDRPFFCAVRDNRTGTLLFIGSIVDVR